jgi:small-conductance mechanosensitive channel
MHYKWFAGVIKKNLFINGNKQVKRTFRLFIIFIFTALTGLIPWVFGFTQEARFMMVEIHDKLAIFCTFYFLYHFAVRHNWLGDYVRSKRKNTDLKVEIYSEE